MLGYFYEHAEYAEDQQHAEGILKAHVNLRGFQVGAALGGATGAIRAVVLRRKSIPAPLVERAFINSVGVGSLVGLLAFGLLTPLRMRGKEEIEWQDRSWRLLANEAQEEVDTWTITGSFLGVAALARRARTKGFQQRIMKVMGNAGVGNLSALGVFMLWRLAMRRES